MQVSLYEAKANLSRLIELAEAGEEIVVSRHKKPVVRIVPVVEKKRRRIGTLSRHPYRMGKRFDDPGQNATLADAFGIGDK